jgi:LmbE family N-acetylglucosaminyl deacetylase
LARLRGKTTQRPAHDVHRLYYYMVPRDRLPTLYVDVTETFETANQAIAAYETQMNIDKQGTAILEVLRVVRAWQGVGAGCPYAEGFLTEDPLRAPVEALLQL